MAKAARRDLPAWRTGAELGEELTCSRPGSEWAPCEEPSGALGSPTYRRLQVGMLGKETAVPPNEVETPGRWLP